MALPPNKPKKTIETPRNYFIWGPTMNGKSYLASEYPNPVIFNTDGNAAQIETPSVDLKNERDPKTGEIKVSVVEQMLGLIKDLEKGGHGFETVVIDVVDDLITLIEQAICEENGVDYVGDVPYGKGWGLRKTFITSIVVRLKALPMNVIYISRYATKLEGTIEKPIPSLGDKDLNVVNGNCDLNIMCQKIGKKYLRRVVDRRKNYQRDWIEDERILKILDSVIGAFDKGSAAVPQTESKVEELAEPVEEKKTLTEIAEEVSVELEDGSIATVVTEKDKDVVSSEENESNSVDPNIEEYVKDNPPPANEPNTTVKAPRTAKPGAPRAPRAPRTK
ncbi:AAA family ATPase [Lysinibacillus agricola]|uniref:AAA family ATPase n=1 Tax=Lysinibacillus agricola TaxID=2590012 RepID=A0ABX7ATP9_9BACI|nr:MULTISPECIES: AAA family ATPase [Lysinibacillus]KOS61709.1 alpha/beta hydrolase [Lysinibacillus sp. FJAT-14222]QQP13031.1 AAA family ATPase [Lysinibacillus agricola]